MEEPSIAWMVTAVAVVIIPIILAIVSDAKKKQDDKSNIPWAPGAIPVLGHALKWRQNPGKFLLECSKQVGEVFQINLAGKHMIIASGARKQRMVATAPESILSARHAIADIGFEQMLGYLNVYKGTDLHKGIVKGLWHTNASQHVVGFIQSIGTALKQETELLSDKKTEFMKLIRRVLLRSTIDRFIGSFF
jgi:hypothetical protein